MKTYHIVTTHDELKFTGEIIQDNVHIFQFKHEDGSKLTVNKQYLVTMIEWESDHKR